MDSYVRQSPFLARQNTISPDAEICQHQSLLQSPYEYNLFSEARICPGGRCQGKSVALALGKLVVAHISLMSLGIVPSGFGRLRSTILGQLISQQPPKLHFRLASTTH